MQGERGGGVIEISASSAWQGNDVGHYGNKIVRLLYSANSPRGEMNMFLSRHGWFYSDFDPREVFPDVERNIK